MTSQPDSGSDSGTTGAIRAALVAADAEVAACPINGRNGRSIAVCPRCKATRQDGCGLDAGASFRFMQKVREALAAGTTDFKVGNESSARNEAKPNVPNQKASSPTPAWLPVESPALEAIAEAARQLIVEGLRPTPAGLIVREKADKSDPHYKLCTALEDAGMIPMSRSRAIAKASQPLPPPPSLPADAPSD